MKKSVLISLLFVFIVQPVHANFFAGEPTTSNFVSAACLAGVSLGLVGLGMDVVCRELPKRKSLREKLTLMVAGSCCLALAYPFAHSSIYLADSVLADWQKSLKVS